MKINIIGRKSRKVNITNKATHQIRVYEVMTGKVRSFSISTDASVEDVKDFLFKVVKDG